MLLRNSILTIASMLCILPLTGCGAVVAGGAIYGYGMFKDPDVNIRAKSYAAADYLIQQASNFVRKDFDVIKVMPFTDTQRAQMSANFDNVIPLQVGERLRQLGYKVDLSSVMADYAAPEINTAHPVKHYAVTGTYTRKPADMDVSIQIVGAKSGHIYGTFDYSMPLSQEMREMATPEAQIYRPTHVKVEAP